MVAVAALAAPAGQGQVALGPVDRAVPAALVGTEVLEDRAAMAQAVPGRAAVVSELVLVAHRTCEVAVKREAAKIQAISPEGVPTSHLAVDLQGPQGQMPEREIPMAHQQDPRDRREAQVELK